MELRRQRDPAGHALGQVCSAYRKGGHRERTDEHPGKCFFTLQKYAVRFDPETDGGCQFELRLENMFRSGKAAAVLYSGGRITGLTVADIAAGDETVFIDIAADTADSAAVFVWSGFSSMVPLCGPVRVTAGV